MAPALSAAATEVYRNLVVFGLDLDNIRLELKRRSGEIVADTIIALGSSRDQVRVELAVQLRNAEELLTVLVELRDDAVVFFSGTRDLVVRAGATLQEPPPLELTYVGPGADAATLDVSPAVASLFTSDSLDFTAAALDANERSVPVVAIAWAVKDPARGAISATGRFRPSLTRGETYVMAKLPTGLKDSAHISIVPVPTQLLVASGNNQSGVVGTALPEPIVVELRAADNLAVPGYPVQFAVTDGGGSLSVTSAISDANGRASTSLTMGSIVGVNTVVASVSGSISVSIFADAVAGAAAQLTASSPSLVSITDSAGANLSASQLPSVTVRDQYGNVLAGTAVKFRRQGNGSLNGSESPEVTVTSTADGHAALSSRRLQTLVGSDTVFATVAGVSDTIEFVATVVNGLAAQLEFLDQPAGSTGGIAMPPFRVAVRDQYGNLVTAGGGSTMQVRLTLENNAVGATLGPDDAAIARAASAGIAEFSGVWVDLAATGYALKASASSSVTPSLSRPFDIAVGPVARILSVSGDSQGALTGTPLTDPLVVRTTDAGGNAVPGISVTFEVIAGGGSLTDGTMQVPSASVTSDANGVASASWTVGVDSGRW